MKRQFIVPAPCASSGTTQTTLEEGHFRSLNDRGGRPGKIPHLLNRQFQKFRVGLARLLCLRVSTRTAMAEVQDALGRGRLDAQIVSIHRW